MKRYVFIFTLFLVVVNCSLGQVSSHSHKKVVLFGEPKNFPLAKIKHDDRAPFRLDPTKPWSIVFGRGGMFGRNTIKINEQGIVLLYRYQFERFKDGRRIVWETATIQLPPEDMTAILEVLNRFHLLKLHRAYYADVIDGAQWILWIRQAPYEKSISCNNHFPKEIRAFSECLDDLLVKRGFFEITWQRVSEQEKNELWYGFNP